MMGEQDILNQFYKDRFNQNQDKPWEELSLKEKLKLHDTSAYQFYRIGHSLREFGSSLIDIIPRIKR